MPTMRCKVTCTAKERIGETDRLTFQPVTCGSPENSEFFRWTPAGQIDLWVVNPSVGERINVGTEFFLDFTPCAAAARPAK